MVMYQGLDKSLSEILETNESFYEIVEQPLAEFYSTKQREDEDVTAWSNRLYRTSKEKALIKK